MTQKAKVQLLARRSDKNDGDGVYKEALLDADSAELFQSLYESVRDGRREISHSLVSWFDGKIPTIKESMFANVRKAEGLDSPPAKFYTHSSESKIMLLSTNNIIEKFPCLSLSRT